MKHAIIALLFLACEEPVLAPAVSPAPPETAAAAEPETVLPVARSGRPFPFDRFGGRWSCDGGWVRYGVSDDDYSEGDLRNVIVEIGRNVHAPSHLTTTVEGCPFFISTIPPPNPSAWNLGPNRCGNTRYTDGFLILDEMGGPPYSPMLIAQISGVEGMHHVARTYSCYRRVHL